MNGEQSNHLFKQYADHWWGWLDVVVMIFNVMSWHNITTTETNKKDKQPSNKHHSYSKRSPQSSLDWHACSWCMIREHSRLLSKKESRHWHNRSKRSHQNSDFFRGYLIGLPWSSWMGSPLQLWAGVPHTNVTKKSMGPGTPMRNKKRKVTAYLFEHVFCWWCCVWSTVYMQVHA